MIVLVQFVVSNFSKKFSKQILQIFSVSDTLTFSPRILFYLHAYRHRVGWNEKYQTIIIKLDILMIWQRKIQKKNTKNEENP